MALHEVDALSSALNQYHLYHATRAELLRVLRRPDEASQADARALERTNNPAERALLRRRLLGDRLHEPTPVRWEQACAVGGPVRNENVPQSDSGEQPPGSPLAPAALGSGDRRLAARTLDLLRDAVLVRGVGDGLIRYWNAGAEALYGWTKDEAVGEPADRLLRTVFPMPKAEIEAQVLASGAWEGELRHTGRDGDEIVVSSRWLVERDQRSRPTAVVQVDTDVTSRRRAEDALRRLALAVRALTEAPFERDHVLATVAGTVAQALRGTCVVWLLGDDAALAPTAAATPDGRPAASLREALAVVPPVSAGGQHGLVMSSGETLLLRPPGPADQRIAAAPPGEGAPTDIGSFLLAPLRARGQPLGTLGTWREPAEPPHSEHERLLLSSLAAQVSLAIDDARRYNEVQEAVHVRDEVLSSVVHDLRGPLTAIVAEARLLERWSAHPKVDRERLARGLRRIESSAMRLSGWIEELLDVARLEQGQPLTLRRTRIDLLDLVKQTVADHQVTTGEHTVVVEEQPETAELLGLFDGPRLRRVLDNLLGNAIKYSPAGGTVSVRLERVERDDGAWATLAVSDQGLGIPAQDQPHVFSRFHRGANVVGRIEGTGIGLARAYQVVRQHGGDIELDSREGHGTTFTVWLPLSGGPRARAERV